MSRFTRRRAHALIIICMWQPLTAAAAPRAARAAAPEWACHPSRTALVAGAICTPGVGSDDRLEVPAAAPHSRQNRPAVLAWAPRFHHLPLHNSILPVAYPHSAAAAAAVAAPVAAVPVSYSASSRTPRALRIRLPICLRSRSR